MRIILVNPRGFCAGVRMAIDVVDELIELCPGEPIYVYHEIVHNRHVVEGFRRRGVSFVEDIQDVPPGAIVVFSAHGVSPQVRRQAAQRRLRAIDATCPLVTKVHMEAIRYAKRGFHILLIGHAGHQEIIGTAGETPNAVTIVESVDEALSLDIPEEQPLVYLTQTTLSMDDAGKIITALQERFPHIKAPPSEDICYATTNRQRAVRALAPQCDGCLVVGSRNSSNSQRLTEIAEAGGCAARLIDDASHLDWDWLAGRESLLLTAGASAPEDLVAEVCRAIVQQTGASLEIGDIFEEDAGFNLPISLRRLMEDRGAGNGGRQLRVQPPQVTRQEYGAAAVRLTIGEQQISKTARHSRENGKQQSSK